MTTDRVCRWLTGLCLCALLCSCEHDELCYRHPHTVPVRIDVDWEPFSRYETPTGMTVTLFPGDGSTPFKTVTNTIDHAVLDLPAGIYHTLVFNQSESEFGSFTFRGMDSAESAVVAVQRSSRWYTCTDEEPVVTEPEWLGVGNLSHAEVTQDMIDARSSAVAVSRAVEPAAIACVVPQNVVHTVTVRIHVIGINNLRSARAALMGMSEGYMLTQGKRLDSKVTYLMENFKVRKDEHDPTRGVIEASFTCFGLPQNHAALPDENEMTLELLLVDNKTVKNHRFFVGDRFVKVRDDGLELLVEVEVDVDGNPVVLPDVPPAGGSSSGFDATVEDWGEAIQQDIPL